MESVVSIDNLIEIVRTGGSVKTGVDVRDHTGMLLLAGDVYTDSVRTLEIIKKNGISRVRMTPEGRLRDMDGKPIAGPETARKSGSFAAYPATGAENLEFRLMEIQETKRQAAEKYAEAKKTIRKVLTDIRNTGGEFDYVAVENHVSDLASFLIVADNPFAYLTREIFSSDDYLYNHSINVCAVGTAVLNRFNSHFSIIVNDALQAALQTAFTDDRETGTDTGPGSIPPPQSTSFSCYYPDELKDISLGFFLHDIGKVMVSESILNKKGALTPAEFKAMKRHSHEYGALILEKNQIRSAIIRNIVCCHHAPLYENEDRCYPLHQHHTDIPFYTRICKLADMYDAMASKRCYKEAVNPISVVTRLFRAYAKKDRMLQYILHAFVRSIGIYPPGSIVFLKNGQMAYVLESRGPLVLPFTDTRENRLLRKPDPIRIDPSLFGDRHVIDDGRTVKNIKKVYDLLPDYLKKIVGTPS